MIADFAQTGQCAEVTPGLGYARIFWMAGVDPNKNPRFRSEVKDPPCNGWMGAFVLDKGGKQVTLFCPFTFRAFPVTKQSAEYNGMVPQRFDAEGWQERFHRTWDENVQRGWARDFDVAASVMRLLDIEVPLSTIRVDEETGEEKTRGGKETKKALTKPVKRDGRRGQVLSFFLAAGGRRSILEAMAEMDVTRKNLLSQLFLLQKDHGIGYTITGDSAEVHLPEGVEDPFVEAVAVEEEVDPLALP